MQVPAQQLAANRIQQPGASSQPALNPPRAIAVLATGGTIAGLAPKASGADGYVAAQVGVADLLAAAGLSADVRVHAEQVAQIDSKDMRREVWIELGRRCRHWLARDEVQGVVITHGTDTIEETAYFLQRVLAPTKPVVLTCAMRPSNAVSADGPRNLFDAALVALDGRAQGVSVVCAGLIHASPHVRKSHTQRLDAFTSGDAGPWGCVTGETVISYKNGALASVDSGDVDIEKIASRAWPRVEVVTNHADADGAIVDALLAVGVQGLVVAGTGGGSVSERLDEALHRAAAQGVGVLRSTRCAAGPVLPTPGRDFDVAGDLTPAKARVALQLALMKVGG